jgi:hypothetical protein
MRNVSTVAFVLMAAMAACSTDEIAPANIDGETLAAGLAATSEDARTNSRTPVHPCDAFTLAEVAAAFAITEDAVTVERGEVPENVYCSYKWERPDADEARERWQAEMMNWIRQGKSPPPLRTDRELFITFHGGHFTTPADAVHGLDTMIERMSKGITAEAGGTSVEFKTSYDAVEGIGNKAVWSASMFQLSAVSGTLLYHVRVRLNGEPADDRPAAETVARTIAARVR